MLFNAGPLFDDHERDYLEKIATSLEAIGYQTFLPHRDAGLVEGEFTEIKKSEIFDIDMNALNDADIVVALLTGRDVDSGTAAEVGIAYTQGKRLIGINANNIKIINNFVWGLFDYGNSIINGVEDLERVLNEK